MPFADATVALPTGVTLSYAEVGAASGPALVMLPGPTDSWRSYGPVLERLPRSIRAIAVSPRGHGDSEKPAHGYGVADLGADVVALLDALAVERAVLAGHSGSCLVARRVALDHPERVAGLLLEASPTTLRGHPGLVALVESVVSTLEDPVDPDVVRSFVTDTSSDLLPPGFVDELVGEVLKVPADVWRELFAGLLEYDDVPELAHVAAPTVLVWGDQDTVVDRDMQTRLVECIPDARLVVHPGVGHTPRWEDPERFAGDVQAFVARVAARG